MATTFTSTAGVANQVAVPDLVGKTRAEAEQKLTDFGLRFQVREVVAEGETGKVLDTVPPAKKLVARGSTVTVLLIVTPPSSTDILNELKGIKAAVAKLETEDDASKRHTRVVELLDEIIKRSSATSTTGASPGKTK